MHPILAKTSRLGLYLLAWLAVSAVLAALLVLVGSLSWIEGAALAAPLGLFYAFLCLSSWNICRAVPAGKSTFARLAGTLGVTSLIAAALWVVLATTFASVLGFFPLFTTLPDRLGRADFVILVLGTLMYLLMACAHYVLLAVENEKELERREEELKRLAQSAELKLLKEQLNPHFLFNSLNSISALTASDPAGAREMCLRLSEFLRQTLGLSDKASIPLREELALAHNYLAVERVRFGQRLQVETTIDPESLECPVPPLLLQPLVENAVKHGVARLTEGGLIRLVTRRTGGRLDISVENAAEDGTMPADARGIGLANVERRVRVKYGADATFRRQLVDGLFRVEISLPAV